MPTKAKATKKPVRGSAAKAAKPPAAAPRKKAGAKDAGPKKAVVKKTATPPPRKAAAKRAPARRPEPLDLSSFPPEAILQARKSICLACVLDVFLRHLHLTSRTAWLEIRKYEPPASELQSAIERPYFTEATDGRCPYCGAPAAWHAPIPIVRIESGKSTDAARRALVKALPEGQFLVVEEKATSRHAFFEWLEQISGHLDFEQPVWLRDISLHYLGRKEPKVNWLAEFEGIHAIRRSRRLAEGWESEDGRLFLAPMLFDELLLVQYLVSRSQKAGGLTLEGRYTLPELFARLRNSGYLRHVGVTTANASDALEALLEYLSGGETSLKFYYIVDRRDYLEKAKALQDKTPPKPKPAS